MRKSTHATFGLTSSLFISSMFALNPLVSVCFGLLYSLLPDADSGYSFINKRLVLVKWLRNDFVGVYYFLVSILLFTIYNFTGKQIYLVFGILTLLIVIGKHRTFYHSLFILVPNYIILYILMVPIDYQALAMFSYIFHLALDMFNPSGVMLFYPISDKVYRFPITVNSSSWISNVVEWLFTCAMLGYTGYYFFRPLL
jgi:inner membrane protein